MVRALSEILWRFRPAVAPGPAGPAGVPADRVAESEAELAGVFAELEPTLATARRCRAEAATAAERIRRDGADEAARIVAEATARLEAVRSESASARLGRADLRRATLEADARTEAERIRAMTDARLPELVERVVAAVRATGADRDAAPGHRRGEVAG